MGLEVWRSILGKHGLWVLLLVCKLVLSHTCCSVDVADVLIDEIHLRESCCDVSENLSMI